MATQDPNTDPFAEIGGGVRLKNGDWVPLDHPLAAQAAPTGTQAAGGASVTGAYAPGSADASLAGQAAAASGVATNPLAAPTGPTANQGAQAVARNSYLEMATQSRVPDANDPTIRRASDAFGANIDRSVRNQVSDAAEAAGPYATGAVRGVSRMAQERGGAQAGEFEANLVVREMDARRNEIQSALQGLAGFISDDQRQALSRELAKLNASLEQQRLGQNASQFADTLGFNVAATEADLNDRAIRLLL